jgi:phosphoribosylformimino-5-aminoimidazole carboxamide ribotide isomerase
MRLIPVIDLLDGRAVHAIKGMRNQYRPVQSMLCDTSDPLGLAAAFRDQLDLHEIYIADLNAIQGLSRAPHNSLIENLCGMAGVRIILDAGTFNFEDAKAWLDLGVSKIVIGSETLNALEDLQDVTARIEPHRLVFSLDLKSGEIRSRCRALANMTPIEFLKQLQIGGWQEVILLDLQRVGSREGADLSLAAIARNTFPDLHLLIGGGITGPEELVELQALGIDGALLATALHNGTVNARHIADLENKNKGLAPL